MGSRMSIPQTGYNATLFARHAKLVMVESTKTRCSSRACGWICRSSPMQSISDGPAREARRLSPLVRGFILDGTVPRLAAALSGGAAGYRERAERVNSYYFIEQLAQRAPDDAVIVTDMGTSFTCTMQTFQIKKGQRLFTSSGLAAMGFGLPGSIGACFGHARRKTISVNGDGGFMFNLQELQTIAEFKLPISIFVLSNGGYLTMQLMQQNHFKRLLARDLRATSVVPISSASPTLSASRRSG